MTPDEIDILAKDSRYNVNTSTDTIHGVEHTVSIYVSNVSPLWRYYNNKTDEIKN